MSIVSLANYVPPVGVLLGGSGRYRPVALPRPDVGVLLRPCAMQHASGAASAAAIGMQRAIRCNE
ncbi:MAG TPA: hypothetical protein VF450_08560 [Noviherbaspirillum sp.]